MLGRKKRHCGMPVKGQLNRVLTQYSNSKGFREGDLYLRRKILMTAWIVR